MTPDAVRIACAEAVGWTKAPTYGMWAPEGFADQPHWRAWRSLQDMPDPANDLNAAFGLVESLRAKGWVAEMNNGLDGTWEVTFAKGYESFYAPCGTLAEVICEAFLLVEGLWVEDTK